MNMHDLEIELDHVGVAVRDLDAGASAYERLGFRLTPRSMHHGAVTTGGPIEPWGSGNHCAMFVDGYLEILGITDQDRHSSAKAMLARYEGAHIVAFGVADAEHAHAALARRGVQANGPRALEREASYGARGESMRPARFRNVYTDSEAFPEARFIFIEHLTRDVLWQAHLLDHPNGALGLAEVTLCVDDLPGSRARLTSLLGIEPKERGRHELDYPLRRGTVRLVTPDGLKRWAPGVKPPLLPYVAGFGISVGSLPATKALLDGHGVRFHEHDGPAIRVGPEFTCGPVLTFIRSEDITHPQDPLVKLE